MSKVSAMPITKKIEYLGQEVFRRLHNTEKEINDEEKVDMMNQFMLKLKRSGYSEHDRFEILKSGYRNFEKLRLKEDQGMRPFYRSRNLTNFRKEEKKQEKKYNWYKKENNNFYTSVFFVPATPGSELLKRLRKTEDNFKINKNCRIKFMETSGRKFIDH